jgi:hypothetical protein
MISRGGAESWGAVRHSHTHDKHFKLHNTADSEPRRLRSARDGSRHAIDAVTEGQGGVIRARVEDQPQVGRCERGSPLSCKHWAPALTTELRCT